MMHETYIRLTLNTYSNAENIHTNLLREQLDTPNTILISQLLLEYKWVIKKKSCCWEVNLKGYLRANNTLTHGMKKMTP